MRMEFVELKKHLKSSPPRACYACFGDDDFVISRAVSLISAVAVEPVLNIVDREFLSARDVTDELMQLPVMSEYRVVIARGKLEPAPIEEYLKHPNPTSVLVLPYYTPHDSWNHTAAVKYPNGSEPVNCSRLPVKYVYPFVRSIASGASAIMPDATVELLYARCGGYMTRIDSEAQKLAAMCAGRTVTEADVTEHVGADTEYMVYELSDSILSFDPTRALEIVDGMAKTNDLVAAFTMLYNRFKRIFAAAVDPDGLELLGVKPFQISRLKKESARFPKARLKNILDMLEKADYGYKTGATSQYDALVGFVVQAAYGGV